MLLQHVQLDYALISVETVGYSYSALSTAATEFLQKLHIHIN
jgi:hypothetical protein